MPLRWVAVSLKVTERTILLSFSEKDRQQVRSHTKLSGFPTHQGQGHCLPCWYPAPAEHCMLGSTATRTL